jgi:hypothetical protein
MLNSQCCFFAAVLGRFVYALNIFCKEAYGMDYDVSDFWVYEFAKVGWPTAAPAKQQSQRITCFVNVVAIKRLSGARRMV